ADWAIVLLAGLRRRLAAISLPNGTGAGPAAWATGLPGDAAPAAGLPGDAAPAARLVFFQHDEVIVHCPEGMAGAVTDAIGSAATEAGQLVFGPTPVRFPGTTAGGSSYAYASCAAVRRAVARMPRRPGRAPGGRSGVAPRWPCRTCSAWPRPGCR